MGIRLKKLNTKGFSHHFLLPLIVILVIAGIGAYIITKSKADSAYQNGAIYYGQGFISQDGKQKSGSYQYKPYGGAGATFSPDGKKIAFIAYEDWASTGPGSRKVINIQNADGTGNVQIFKSEPLTEPNQVMNKLSWSKDGKSLAFVVPTGDTWDQQSIALLGTTPDSSGAYPYDTVALPDEISTDVSPQKIAVDFSFYPDSQKLGYVVNIEGTPTICSMKLDGTENKCTKIAQPSNLSGTLSLSSYSNDMQVVGTGTEAILNLGVSDHDACDQTCPFATNFYKVNIAAGSVVALTSYDYTSAASAFITRGMVSPDEGKIVYSVSNNSPTTPRSDIYVLDIGTKKSTMILDHMFLSNDSAWQPYATGKTQPSVPYNVSYDLGCTLSTSGTVTGGKPLAFTVNLKNNSPSPITVTPKVTYTSQDMPSTGLGSLIIDPGATQSVTGQTPAVPYAYEPGATLEVRVQPAESTISCLTKVVLPTSPLILNDKSPRTIPYNSSTKVTGRTAPNNYVNVDFYALNGTLIYHTGLTKSDASGNFSTPLPSSISPLTKDITYVVNARGVTAPRVKINLRALVSGATTRTVNKNSDTTVSGKYSPGAKLVVHMRKPTDKAGTYPRTIAVTVNSSGNYSFTFKADTKKIFYVTSSNGAATPSYTVNVK